MQRSPFRYVASSNALRGGYPPPLSVARSGGSHSSCGVNPNTVQLDAEDGVDGWPGGLGPCPVVGPFDVPLGHLALDEPWVRAEPATWVEALEEQSDGMTPSVISGMRGENRAPLGWSGARCAGRRRS